MSQQAAVQKLIDEGLIWLINTAILHPRGMALCYELDDDGDVVSLGAIDWGEYSCFDVDEANDAVRRYVEAEVRRESERNEPEERHMNTYVTLVEHNEWEGETWRHYIPVEGNEDALERLGAIIAEESHFTLVEESISESRVDRRVAEDQEGCDYLPCHTKLEGQLVIPTPTPIQMQDGWWWEDRLYKGGIKDWMRT